MSNICITVAQRKVRDYTDESDRLMQEHKQGMNCRDCEGFLQRGMEAYRWLQSAEEFLREADYQGAFEFDSDLRDAFDVLYESWLGPREFAENWIREVQERGYTPENLGEFRAVCEEARDTIQEREWRKIAERARVLSPFA